MTASQLSALSEGGVLYWITTNSVHCELWSNICALHLVIYFLNNHVISSGNLLSVIAMEVPMILFPKGVQFKSGQCPVCYVMNHLILLEDKNLQVRGSKKSLQKYWLLGQNELIWYSRQICISLDHLDGLGLSL